MAEGGVEGEVLIDLCWVRGRVTQVDIRSTRPLLMPRLFFGKPPSEVLSTLPLIYSVCGVAQGCAAAEALEQALALSVSSEWRKRRRLLVAFETLKEHLWRIELDWARYLNRASDSAGISRLVSLMRGFRTTLFPGAAPFILGGLQSGVDVAGLKAQMDELERLLEARVFFRPTQRWLQILERKDLSQWYRARDTLAQEMLFQVENGVEAGLGRSRIPALGELDATYLNQRLTSADADKFIAQPDWLDIPAETTPYTRRRGHPMLCSLGILHGNGLLPRLTARLVELAVLAGEIQEGIIDLDREQSAGYGSDLTSGIGISQVEAARGRLVHRVELEAGRVANYQILAPTEWNFHPRGALASGLQGLEADDEACLKNRADLMINTIDPCVGYRLRINASECEKEPERL